MSNIRRISDTKGFTPIGPHEVMRNNRTMRQWDTESLAEVVAHFLQSQRRAGLSKDLQRDLNKSESTTEKLIGGRLSTISGPLLLNLDAYFNGELYRTLRGLPDPDDAGREILRHAEAIRRLARL